MSNETRDTRLDDDDDDDDDKGLLECSVTYMHGIKPATTAVTFFREDVTPYRCSSDEWSLRSHEL